MSGKVNCVFLSLLLFTLANSTAFAETEVTVEAESYVGVGWNDNGGAGIQLAYCEQASQEWCAQGLDKHGDWIQLEIHVPQTGEYDATIAFQSWLEQEYLLSIWPAGKISRTVTASFSFVGEGAG
jgi:hypothetical protein